ncbi:hypothetical protein BD310DRAFT_884657 [Dichomitus squalens]|uniref:Uncharacterized protein n=1 Tax=Dichomitus squalens TaxID=114155 RepID=A0A4Q9PLZ5_9APHY|nr:hypothetical protein BD310DRAFT_884657 [Dichomitus squalens]
MRLIETRTGRFRWFDDPRTVRYAVLSHVWSKEDDPNHVPEQTYQDVCRIHREAGDGVPVLPLLSDKIRSFCDLALAEGYEFAWADTCCIDKSSSAELSEALNSMYNWYGHAVVCYAYLPDVSNPSRPPSQEWELEFRTSRWFTRGWTLQELLAPGIVIFLSSTWECLGSKRTLSSLVTSITGIPHTVLTMERALNQVSVAERLRWASSRITSRKEDEAYCLMGIFGVHISITYGEGSSAFMRLQEKILKHIPDQTLLVWGSVLPSTSNTMSFRRPSDVAEHIQSSFNGTSSPLSVRHSIQKQCLLSSSPAAFKNLPPVLPLSAAAFAAALNFPVGDSSHRVFTITPYGIHARFPLVQVQFKDTRIDFPAYLAPLACSDEDGTLYALLLHRHMGTSTPEYFVGTSFEPLGDSTSTRSYSTFYPRAVRLNLSPDEFSSLRASLEVTTVYILHRHTPMQTDLDSDNSGHDALKVARRGSPVILTEGSQKLLALQGYRVPAGRTVVAALSKRQFQLDQASGIPGIVIWNDDEYITIQLGCCNCEFGERVGLLAVLVHARNASIGTTPDQFTDDVHPIDHPVHVRSWTLSCGTATKHVHLAFPSGGELSLTLTLAYRGAAAEASEDVYMLAIEILGFGGPSRPAILKRSSRSPSPAQVAGSAPARLPLQGYSSSQSASPSLTSLSNANIPKIAISPPSNIDLDDNSDDDAQDGQHHESRPSWPGSPDLAKHGSHVVFKASSQFASEYEQGKAPPSATITARPLMPSSVITGVGRELVKTSANPVQLRTDIDRVLPDVPYTNDPGPSHRATSTASGKMPESVGGQPQRTTVSSTTRGSQRTTLVNGSITEPLPIANARTVPLGTRTVEGRLQSTLLAAQHELEIAKRVGE